MSSHDETIIYDDVWQLQKRMADEGHMNALNRISEIEPVITGFIAAMACILMERLREYGVPDIAIDSVERDMMLAQLVCVEATLKAQRALWEDLLPQDDDPELNPKP